MTNTKQMNAERNSLTLVPSNLLDSTNDTWAAEFARSIVWGGLQSPLLGATQLIDKTCGTELQPKVQFMHESSEAQAFTSNWHARQLGSMGGMALPFLLLHKGVGICGNRLLGKLESDAAASLLTTRAVGESIATGMLFDGLLRPVSGAQQQDFAASRAKNALIGGITFGVMTRTSFGLRSLMHAEQGAAAGLIRSEVGSSILSGIPAGIANAELNSRTYEGRGASREKLAEAVYCFSVLGGTMAAGKRCISTTAEADLSYQLQQKSLIAREARAPTLADRLSSALSNAAGTLEHLMGRPAPAVVLADGSPGLVGMEQGRSNTPVERSPLAESTGEVIAIKGGGTIRLMTDGTAIVKDGASSKGDKLHYRSMGADGQNTQYLLLYDLKATPTETASTIQVFALDAKSTPVEIETASSYLEPWTNWRESEIAALNQAIPKGSIPIGIGVSRQAWLTPNDHIVVIGPFQERPDSPYLRKPFKVEEIGTFKQIEWFEYADSRGITPEDVAAFDARMAKDGWVVKDSKPMNYARSRDGKMWRIDPDDVDRKFIP